MYVITLHDDDDVQSDSIGECTTFIQIKTTFPGKLIHEQVANFYHLFHVKHKGPKKVKQLSDHMLQFRLCWE